MASIQSYELHGKKLYKFQIYIGTDPLTGKRKKTTKSGFKTKKEAQLALSRLQLEIERGDFKKSSNSTFNDIYELWIEQYRNTVESSTLLKTKGIFKNHIIPSMGQYKMEKINVQACQKHVNEWFKVLKKYRLVRSYASQVFEFAITLGVINENPMLKVSLPKTKIEPVEDEVQNYYTREELIEFLQCLEKDGDYKIYTFFRLLAFSGMRKGEALALTWNDLNLKDGELRVNKAVARGEDNQLYIKSTKNQKSIRTISLDETTLSILTQWKKQQRQDYLILGHNTLKSNQLIFSNVNNELLQPTKTQEWITKVQKKYNLKSITTHGLRHTHCSLLFEAGATIKEVQERLGHGDVQTTMNIYAHVTEKAKKEAAVKFASYMNF